MKLSVGLERFFKSLLARVNQPALAEGRSMIRQYSQTGSSLLRQKKIPRCPRVATLTDSEALLKMSAAATGPPGNHPQN